MRSSLFFVRIITCLSYLCHISKSYKGIATLYNWDDAQAQCESRFNSNLATIVNRVENSAVYDICDKINGLTACWVGLFQLNDTDPWVWVSDGEEHNFLNWNPGQPNDAGGYEDCAEVIVENYSYNANLFERFWNDQQCTEQRYAVCDENDPSPSTHEPSDSPSVDESFDMIMLISIIAGVLCLAGLCFVCSGLFFYRQRKKMKAVMYPQSPNMKAVASVSGTVISSSEQTEAVSSDRAPGYSPDGPLVLAVAEAEPGAYNPNHDPGGVMSLSAKVALTTQGEQIDPGGIDEGEHAGEESVVETPQNGTQTKTRGESQSLSLGIGDV